jgi:hypothetical protein
MRLWRRASGFTQRLQSFRVRSRLATTASFFGIVGINNDSFTLDPLPKSGVQSAFLPDEVEFVNDGCVLERFAEFQPFAGGCLGRLNSEVKIGSTTGVTCRPRAENSSALDGWKPAKGGAKDGKVFGGGEQLAA